MQCMAPEFGSFFEQIQTRLPRLTFAHTPSARFQRAAPTVSQYNRHAIDAMAIDCAIGNDLPKRLPSNPNLSTKPRRRSLKESNGLCLILWLELKTVVSDPEELQMPEPVANQIQNFIDLTHRVLNIESVPNATVQGDDV
jgi:hypothetical protein